MPAMMSSKAVLAAFFLVTAAYAASEASQASTQAMEQIFARSDKVHSTSMASIMSTMTDEKAMQVLGKSNVTHPVLLEISSLLHGKQTHLRRADPINKGYSGVDNARKLLNDMIDQAQGGYDNEIMRCTGYYSEQCAAMEMGRGQIAQSNYLAAESRLWITGAQQCINRMEVTIPTLKEELKNHKAQCKEDIAKMRATMKMIEGDIQVIAGILDMIKCEELATAAPTSESALIQASKTVDLLRCEDPCTKTAFVTFKRDDLKEAMSKLQSPKSHKIMQESLADLVGGGRSLQAITLVNSSEPTVNISITKWPEKPVPRTEIPQDPCTDPSGGRPTLANKRAAKCVPSGKNCFILQERFLLIQTGIVDTKNALLEDIVDMEAHCKETDKALEDQISNDQEEHDSCQVDLSTGTTKEATAGENARETAKQNELMEQDLRKQMKACTKRYIDYETEVCAYKKIRRQVYKMQGSGHANRVFVDCEMSKWTASECKSASGDIVECHKDKEPYGEQILTRSALTEEDGGAKCLPFTADKKCNMQPCPINCKKSDWSEWSRCSAECGGGVRQRLKEVERPAGFGGEPCGETSSTETCNGQSCEKDCELSEWTRWSWCSKDCNTGTRKRQKFIKHAPKGEGKCPDEFSPERLEYKECNKFKCLSTQAGDCSTYKDDTNMYTCSTLPQCCLGHEGLGHQADAVQCLPSEWKHPMSELEPSELEPFSTQCGLHAKRCHQELDIVFLIDGSGSLGEYGWRQEIKAAKMFVDAFDFPGVKAKLGVILYSGPSTWSGVYKCKRGSGDDHMRNVCKIRTISHLTGDMATLKAEIGKLPYPKGSTLTSLALLRAEAELNNGRPDAKSIIVVFTDGRPLSYRETEQASRKVRKMSRLLWVPVTRFAPLGQIKKYATRRWQENVVVVKEFKDLDSIAPVSAVVADICVEHKSAWHAFDPSGKSLTEGKLKQTA